MLVNLRARARYASASRTTWRENGGAHRRFSHPVLNLITDRAKEAARASREPNTQAIIESHFHSELKALLLGERFVRAASGLVIILGLMGNVLR